jgi:flagellar motor switch protein FliG
MYCYYEFSNLLQHMHVQIMAYFAYYAKSDPAKRILIMTNDVFWIVIRKTAQTAESV